MPPDYEEVFDPYYGPMKKTGTTTVNFYPGLTTKPKPVREKKEAPEDVLKHFQAFIDGITKIAPTNVPENWVKCALFSRTGEVRVPPDQTIKVFGQGIFHLAHKIHFERGAVWQDFAGNFHYGLTEKSSDIYNEEGKKLAFNPNFSYGNIYQTMVIGGNGPNRNVWTTFKTFYRDHASGDQKSYEKPNGEAFGVEFEVKFADTPEVKGYIRKLFFSAWMNDNFPKWICERDGSLEGQPKQDARGLEFISPPLSLDQILQDLETILPKCVEMGGLGYSASTETIPCGIHVTQNLYGSNTKRDGDRYVWIINNEEFREFWQKVAQRSGAKFDEYCGFKEIPEEGGAMQWQIEYSANGSGFPYGHYCAVFPRAKGKALETRIYRSNLKFSTVKSIIMLNKLTMDFCKNARNKIEPAAFADFLKEQADEDLLKFLNSKKIRAFDFLEGDDINL